MEWIIRNSQRWFIKLEIYTLLIYWFLLTAPRYSNELKQNTTKPRN